MPVVGPGHGRRPLNLLPDYLCFVSKLLDFALAIASLVISSKPHKTAVGILSDPLQNGSSVTPLSDELMVTLFTTRSTRRVLTIQIGQDIRGRI